MQQTGQRGFLVVRIQIVVVKRKILILRNGGGCSRHGEEFQARLFLASHVLFGGVCVIGNFLRDALFRVGGPRPEKTAHALFLLASFSSLPIESSNNTERMQLWALQNEHTNKGTNEPECRVSFCRIPSIVTIQSTTPPRPIESHFLSLMFASFFLGQRFGDTGFCASRNQ